VNNFDNKTILEAYYGNQPTTIAQEGEVDDRIHEAILDTPAAYRNLKDALDVYVQVINDDTGIEHAKIKQHVLEMLSN